MLEHPVGEESRQDAASRDAGQPSRLLQDAELMQAPCDAEVEQAGAVAAARQGQSLSR